MRRLTIAFLAITLIVNAIGVAVYGFGDPWRNVGRVVSAAFALAAIACIRSDRSR